MKTKRIYYIAAAILLAASTAVSCAGMNSLSDDEAYSLGYGIGKVAGHYLNN